MAIILSASQCKDTVEICLNTEGSLLNMAIFKKEIKWFKLISSKPRTCLILSAFIWF